MTNKQQRVTRVPAAYRGPIDAAAGVRARDDELLALRLAHGIKNAANDVVTIDVISARALLSRLGGHDGRS
jgi:hypothetical protein